MYDVAKVQIKFETIATFSGFFVLHVVRDALEVSTMTYIALFTEFNMIISCKNKTFLDRLCSIRKVAAVL